MQGIIVIDKPQGFTSFDVIAKLRGILKTKKIGHSGTLDPMATGVLPVFVGQAAKAVDMQVCHNKQYEAVIRFGIKTDTGDITGTVLEEKNVCISKAAFVEALKELEGEQSQLPPMYSAVKINGQPLYKLARKGQVVERAFRKITIYKAELIEQRNENEFAFSVLCSKGTYIRTLCEDLGDKLSAPATLSELRRTLSGVYSLQKAYGFEQIQAAKDENRVQELLQCVDTVFEHLPALQATQRQRECLLNGLAFSTSAQAGEHRIYFDNEFLGVVDVADGQLRVKKLFCERE